MTDTTITTDTGALPGWLREAEAARDANEQQRRTGRNRLAAQYAEMTNARLREFGIEPEVPARADASGSVVPARLTAADPGRELYSVHAAWDVNARGIRLLVGDFDSRGFPGQLPARPLHTLADVAHARHDGPGVGAVFARLADLHAAALDVEDCASRDTAPYDLADLARAIGSLAAAVLYRGQARADDRP